MDSTPSPALITAIRRLLRPLIRLMLSKGVTYPFLSDLLKGVFVEVADKEFQLGNKPQTDSRISLLTGVHRKDVRRLRSTPYNDESAPAAVSLGALLVARWVGSPDYLDIEGNPKPLPRLASAGGPCSFEGLVASVSKDIRSRAILDEWLRLGVAQVDEADHVRLNTDAFIPEKGFEEKAYYFGTNIHDHLAACAHNLADNTPPMLERSVYYDQLDAASVQELAAFSRELGMQTLKKINRRAMELQRKNAGQSDANQRMNFGVYFYNTSVESLPETETHLEAEDKNAQS